MSIFSLYTGRFRHSEKALGVFVESEPYEKGFSQHYNKYIKPYIVSFEEKRLEALEKTSRRLKMVTPFLLILLSFTILITFQANGDDDVLVMHFMAVLINFCVICWVYQPTKQYKDSIKADIFPHIISFLKGFSYSSECGARAENLKASSIISKYHNEKNQDEIVGQYKGVGISIFRSVMEYGCFVKDKQDIFRGIIITLDMNKNFSGKTLIKSREAFHPSREISQNFEPVKLEDPDFNKMFLVFSNDQVEARYLLTLSFLERLRNLAHILGGVRLECSFFEGKLTIMLWTCKNFLEPGCVFEPEDFVDDAKIVLKEINEITQIIDVLQLNQRTGI